MVALKYQPTAQETYWGMYDYNNSNYWYVGFKF